MLQGHKIFPKPPITEAIFDIRACLPTETTIEVLEGIHEEIKDRFPTKEQKYSIQAEFNAPDKETIECGTAQIPTKTNTIGFMFKSDMSKKIFQARHDGFTFNKLKPYEDWESFSAEAKELWNIYKKHTNPKDITRIALRYINRIDIPLPFEGFSEYLVTAPQLPEGMPQGLSGFFMQYFVPKPEIRALAVITQTIENPSETTKLPFILDIDVFKEGSFNDNDDFFWENFQELRDYKNQIFFNCLTEKAKGLFE